MSDTKLKKINQNLYKEGSFKWTKRLEPLFITLRNVRISRVLSIERHETSFLRSVKDTVGKGTLAEENSTEGKEATTSAGDEPEEKYSESFGWRVTAIGYLDHKIGLIREDGTLTGPGEFFDSADVILRPIPTNVSDTDKEKVFGDLFYSDASFENRADPYLTLELHVPASPLEHLCHELVSSRLSKLIVGVFVDVFQSEVDRSLAEPQMRLEYHIEEENIFNRAYLSSLDAHRDIAKTRASGTDDIEYLGLESGNEDESVASLRHLLSTQAEALCLANQRLAHIRTVGILVAIVLLLMLLLK